MEIYEAIGITIRKLRQERSWSQEMLAFKAEMDRAYLSEIENGYKNLSVQILEQIAQALDVAAVDLLAGYERH